MCISVERSYPGTTRAPAAARAFVTSVVVAALDPAGWELADDVSVVVSDLVTEAAESGASTIDVRATVHYEEVALSVAHREPTAMPANREPEGTRATRGAVLEALTAELSTKLDSEGRTCVHAKLACNPAHTRKVYCRFRPGGVG
jgi:hypothetical protein